MLMFIKNLEELTNGLQRVELFADSEDDLDYEYYIGIDKTKLAPGSRCVIANGDIYFLNTQGEWVAAGTPSPRPPQPEPEILYCQPGNSGVFSGQYISDTLEANNVDWGNLSSTIVGFTGYPKSDNEPFTINCYNWVFNHYVSDPPYDPSSSTFYLTAFLTTGSIWKNLVAINGMDTWDLKYLPRLTTFINAPSTITRTVPDKIVGLSGMNKWNTKNLKEINGFISNLDFDLLGDEIDLSNWDTSSLSSLGSFLTGCVNAKTCGIENWNPTVLIHMWSTFINSDFTRIDLSKWDITFPEDGHFYDVFKNCASLEFVDISGIDCTAITKDSSKKDIFYGVPNTCEIVVKNQAMLDFLQEKYPDFTNIHIKEA